VTAPVPVASGTATTPGQAFRDALRDRWIARGRWVDMRPYDQLPDDDIADLEAGAQAAIDAGTGKLAAEITRLRQEREVYRASAVMHCRERDEAQAEADRLRPLEAEAQRAHAEVTRLRAQRDDYMTDLAAKIRERDDAREGADKAAAAANRLRGQFRAALNVLEEGDEPDDDARQRATAILRAGLEPGDGYPDRGAAENAL